MDLSSAAGPANDAMHHYRLFGDVLRSEVSFPELEQTVVTTPRWTLRCADPAPPLPDGRFLGEDVVTGDVRVRMYDRDHGLRIVFDDTGCFDVSPDGALITWYRPPDAQLSDVRADLTGRVIAAALHLTGTVSLHASAVVVSGSAIGLIGVKGRGKSTLALALVRNGARLLTDDTLPVTQGSPPLAMPGLHATRLWPDSASRVGLGRAEPAEPGAKMLYSHLPEQDITNEAAPLVALYILSPSREALNDSPVWRTPLPGVQAALALVGHSKLAPLLRHASAGEMMKAAGDLTSRVPVYRLDVVRDLDTLPEVAAVVRGWHTPPDTGGNRGN